VLSPLSKNGEACRRCAVRFKRKNKKYAFEEGAGHICDSCYKERKAERAPLQPLVRAHSAPVPFVTPEKQTQLRTQMKAEALGQQGKSLSVGAKSRVVLQLERSLQPDSPMKQLGWSYDRCVKWQAANDHIAPVLVRRLHAAAAAGQSLANPPVKRLQLDSPRHVRFGATGPSLRVELCLFQHMRDVAENNLYSSLSTLVAHIFQETGEQIAVSTLHNWLGKLHISYGEKKLTGLPRAYTAALVRRYLVRYADLLRRESKGEIVLVWMDESYIHAGYCAKSGWFIDDDENTPTKNRTRGQEKGKRIIIIHAMTREGMLEAVKDESEETSENLAAPCASALIVSTLLSAESGDKEDYHDTMDGEKFVAWLTNRLIVAFEAMFPGKKMCLILDNAKYHHARGADWVNPSAIKGREQLAEELIMRGICDIKQGKKTFHAGNFFCECRGTSNPGPTVKLMRDVLKWYVASHPINSTLVEQTMKAKGHELLYTPPYESWMQPIELVWAQVKKEVAMQSHRERKYQETAQQTRTALRNVTAERCASLVSHTERLMETWLQSSDAGSLAQWPTLTALMSAPHEVISNHADQAVENIAGGKESVEENEEEQEEEKQEQAQPIVVTYLTPGTRRSSRVSKQISLHLG
jgi:hypothetical protein